MEPILTREELADLLAPLDGTSKRQNIFDTPDENERDEDETEQNALQLDDPPGEDSDKTKLLSAVDEPLPDIPNLDVVLGSFTRYLGARLSTVLRRPFSVEQGEMRVSTFAGAMSEQQENGAVAICAMSPLPDVYLVHLDQSLAFLLLETILGNTSAHEITVPERKLSVIETALMHTGLTIICQCLKKAMELARRMSFQVLRVENDFRLLGCTDAEDSCLDIFFPVHMDDVAQGVLHLLLPLRALEVLRADFASLTEMPSTKGNDYSAPVSILATSCCLRARAQLPGADMPAGCDLSAGHIVEITADPTQEVLLMLEGQALFRAIQVPEHGQRVLRLVERINNEALTDASAPVDEAVQSGEDTDQDNKKNQLFVELGCIPMLMQDVLRLDVGSIVFMDQQADDSLGLYAGSRWIGRAELLRLDKSHALRLLGPVSVDAVAREN